MKVAGLDICKGYAVAWILDSYPADPKKVFKQGFKGRNRNPEKDDLTFAFDAFGIETFLSWEVEAICLEPTGMRYSAFIAKVAEHHGIKIFWVNHNACKAFREQNELPDKNDIADSFALACYCHLYAPLGNSTYFIRFESNIIPQVRDLYMHHKFLTKLSTQCVNRLQIQLSFEYPEIAGFRTPMQPSKEIDKRRPLVCEIAGRDRDISRASHWKKRLQNSIAKKYGVEISDFSKYLAGVIDDLDLKLMAVESELSALVFNPRFSVYNQIFDRFKMGLIHRAIILCQIYPFSQRFNDLPSFKRRLGLSRIEVQSGTKKGDKKGSSSALCRREWYLWVSYTAKLKTKNGSSVAGALSSDLAAVVAYHDEINLKFSTNPDFYKDTLKERYKHRVKRHFLNSLQAELGVLGASAVLERLDLESYQVPDTVLNRGFGHLVIMKTAGYACKKLYRALDEVRSSLD